MTDNETRDDQEARVEQLASDIDDTRGDLTRTIAEIGDRLDPATIARDAGETVRSAALGKVEQMSYGAQETWRDVRSGNAGGIVDTITSNPIPAGMVALGLGMLFMSRGSRAGDRHDLRYDRRSGDLGGYGRGRASWEATEWQRTSGGGSPLDRAGTTVADAGEVVGRAADQAGQKLTGVMDNVGQAAGELPQQAGVYVERGAGTVRRFLDENPLGAGVVALAAGAVIGLLVPTTTLERETIGQARDQLVEKAEGTVHEALDEAEQRLDRETADAASQA